jgi:signal transduction histidine kinase
VRFALKSTLVLLLIYITLLTALAVWIDRRLERVAAAIMAETARLVGEEAAMGVARANPGSLLRDDGGNGERLSTMLDELTSHSGMVADVLVVDARGRTVASDRREEVGREAQTPHQIFHGKDDQILYRYSGDFLAGGDYLLYVPILDRGELVGYMRLALVNDPLAEVYGQARRHFWAAFAIGLAVIGALGIALHGYLGHRGRALAVTLERAGRGEPVARQRDGDEFAHAFEVAGKLGRELSRTRERTTEVRRRFTALSQAVSAGVLLLGADRELDFINETGRRLLGWESDEEARRAWREVLRPRLEEDLQRAHDRRPRAVYADVDLEPGGKTAPGEEARRLRFEICELSEEECEGHLILVHDHDLAEALETDLRLATQVRGLSRLYAAVAHDLKAPLNAMVLNLELLRESLKGVRRGDASDEKRDRYFQVLGRELAQLNRSLEALLAYAVPHQEGGRKSFDARQLLLDLGQLLEPQARRQRVELAVEVPPLPLTVVGHRDRLRQALLNIALNGLEAMPGGGRLVLRMEADATAARIVVGDSGPGIPAEVADKIWQMHFTTKKTGTGVGLYVARSVIEAHGGRIAMESRPAGTSFLVELPMAPDGVHETLG